MSSFPTIRHEMEYVCTKCNAHHSIDELLYTCPDCGGVLLLNDKDFDEHKKIPGKKWQEIFDERRATNCRALKGIFRYYEFMAPVLEEEDIIYLGDGHSPIITASKALREDLGIDFAFKHEGQNPSASFKDRGMAGAFSYLKSMVRKHGWNNILTICASTGDTSAAAALYGAYVGDPIKTVVLLPEGKVTPQQLSQPLGSGATVLQIPGVFDDCMKVVEYLASHYRVALLNSKNSWRILGQESYAYEVAQEFRWDMKNKALFVPIGNAGNITAIMSGFIKMKKLDIIEELPRLFGVQSHHADPVYQYYHQNRENRVYHPVQVKASVAQAAMIGNPVSFPRVQKLVAEYEALGGDFNVVQVTEQAIMNAMIIANRNGHIACTQGGECLAGLVAAREQGKITHEFAILDATAHALKFAGFQEMYFENTFPPEFGVVPKESLQNRPRTIISQTRKDELPFEEFVQESAHNIAEFMSLTEK